MPLVGLELSPRPVLRGPNPISNLRELFPDSLSLIHISLVFLICLSCSLSLAAQNRNGVKYYGQYCSYPSAPSSHKLSRIHLSRNHHLRTDKNSSYYQDDLISGTCCTLIEEIPDRSTSNVCHNILVLLSCAVYLGFQVWRFREVAPVLTVLEEALGRK